jgi:hypothetical protein
MAIGGSFPGGGLSGRGVKLTTHLQPVPGSRKRGSILHSPIRLHGVVLDYLSSGTTSSFLWILSLAETHKNKGRCIWDSHSRGYEEFYLLAHNAMYFVESQPTFRKNTSPPSSGLRSKPSKQPSKQSVCCLLVCFYQTARLHIPEDSTLYSLTCLVTPVPTGPDSLQVTIEYRRWPWPSANNSSRTNYAEDIGTLTAGCW